MLLRKIWQIIRDPKNLAVLTATAGLMAFAHAAEEKALPDSVMEFVHQVMRTEMDYTRQFERQSRDRSKDRWPNERSAQMDRLRNISRKFLLDQDISPQAPMNSYTIDDYEILGRRGPFVFVRQKYSDCMHNDCADANVLTLNVVKEEGRYLLLPGDFPPKSTTLAYWWAASHAPFIMPNPEFCTTPTPASPTQMRATVDAFMAMMVEENKSKFTRRQRLEHLARSFFQDQGADPALLEVNNYSFSRYSIVGIYGPYVDVQLVHPATCATCDTNYLRLKTVVEDGKVRLMPREIESSSINYWWTFSMGQHVPLCVKANTSSRPEPVDP